mmetsp:Transcript_17423/g.39088  ORF Transcript_17423/g.39088 Transcript_17423/m.39088 type:complete len:202 (+) Transcript_17423:1160-1765(+)
MSSPGTATCRHDPAGRRCAAYVSTAGEKSATLNPSKYTCSTSSRRRADVRCGADVDARVEPSARNSVDPSSDCSTANLPKIVREPRNVEMNMSTWPEASSREYWKSKANCPPFDGADDGDTPVAILPELSSKTRIVGSTTVGTHRVEVLVGLSRFCCVLKSTTVGISWWTHVPSTPCHVPLISWQATHFSVSGRDSLSGGT